MGGLSLAGNKLKSLPDLVFQYTPLEVRSYMSLVIITFLQRLDLSFNMLENLDSNLLTSSYNIETLDLSFNNLVNYSLYSENNFRRLQILNLAHNNLTRIERDWQSGYLNLRELNVSHNSIGPMIHNR